VQRLCFDLFDIEYYIENPDNDLFPNTRLENALTGEQMRLRIYTYKRDGRDSRGVAMVVHRGPLPVSAADPVSSIGEEEDWFQKFEKPNDEKFFGITETMSSIISISRRPFTKESTLTELMSIVEAMSNNV
jgi:hypothetical protein